MLPWWETIPPFPNQSYGLLNDLCEIVDHSSEWDWDGSFQDEGFLAACQEVASGASNNATTRFVEDKTIYQLTAVKYEDCIAVTRVNLGPELESKNDEELYSAAFKASPIPLFITDTRGKQCVGINEAASREFAEASGNAKRTKVEPFSPSYDNTAFLPWDKYDEMAVSSLLEGGTGFCEFETGNARSSSCRQAFRVAGREEPYIVGTIEYSASDLVPSAVYDATSELCDGDMRNSEILPNGQPGMAKSMCHQTLDALLRVTTEPITVCRVSGDNKLICVVANDAACQACGLPHADLIGFDYDTIMSKFEHFGEISEQVRQDDDDLLSSLDNKGPVSAHKTYTLGSGHGFDRVSMAFRLPGDAQPYIVSKVHDITESMLRDKELEIARDEAEQSRNMARAMLHVIPIPVAVRRVSEDNKFIYVEMNEAACQITGLLRDQVIGVDDESIIAGRPCADPERVALIIDQSRIIDNALLESLAAGDPQVLQESVTIESGASFDRFVKIFTIPGDDQPYIMSVWVDITELKDHEKQLMQAKDEAEKVSRMLTAILNVIPEPITVRRLGENGASFYVEANEVACKKYGTTREELIGKDDMSATLAMPGMTEEIANDIVSAARQMDNTLLTAFAEDTQPVSLQMTWTNKLGKIFDRRVQAFKMPGENQPYIASISINITELKNHEKQLTQAKDEAEKANQMLTAILNVIPELITVRRLGENGASYYVEANEVACKKYGTTREELIGKDDMSVMLAVPGMTEKYASDLMSVSRKLDDTAVTALAEDRQQTSLQIYAESNNRWFDRRVQAFRIPGENQPYIASISINITELKDHEKQLTQAKDDAEKVSRMLTAILNVIPESITVRRLGENGASFYVEANEVACKKYGTTREELIGKDDMSVMLAVPGMTEKSANDLVSASRKLDNTLLTAFAEDTQPVSLQMTWTNKLGKIFDRRVQAFKMPGENQPYIASISIDITELKNHEKQLIQAKDEAEKANLMLTTILNVIPEPITVRRLGENGASYYVEANEVACKKYGTTREELIGKDDMTVVLATPGMTEKYASDVMSAVRKMDDAAMTALAENSQPASLQMYVETVSRWFDRRIRAIRIPGENQPYVVSVMIDITELKNHEKQLIQAKDETEKARRLLSAILEAIPSPISVRRMTEDSQFIYVEANEAACGGFGLARAEVIGFADLDVILKRPDAIPEFAAMIIQHHRQYDVVVVKGLDGDGPRALEEEYTTEIGQSFNSRLLAFRVPGDEQPYIVSMSIDITELKNHERQLIQAKDEAERSHEMLGAIIDEIPAAITVRRLTEENDFIIFDVNDTLCKMLRVPREQLIGADDYELVNLRPGCTPEQNARLVEDARKQDVALIEGLVNGDHRSKSLHFEIRGETGQFYDRRVHAFKVPGDNQPYFVSLTYDITEMKQRERQLELANRKLNAILNVIPNPISVSHLSEENQTIIVEVNEALCQAFGMSRDEIIGVSDEDVLKSRPTVNPSEIGKILNDIHEAAAGLYASLDRGENAVAELEVCFENGVSMSQRCMAFRGPDDDQPYIVSSSMDIAELKNREKQLVQAKDEAVKANRMLMAILNVIPEPITVRRVTEDNQFVFSEVNEKMCELSGLSRADIIGSDDHHLALLTPEIALDSTVLAGLDSDGPSVMQRQVVMETGSIFDQRMMAFRVPGDEQPYIVELMIDITQMKNNEKQLMLAKDERARQMLRDAEAQTKLEKVIAENKYKTEFMSRMSHELKTPLAVMTSATEHLIDGGDSVEHWHGVQLESCALLKGLIDNVLVLHRIETGQQQLTNEPFSIRDVAGGILKMLSVSAHLKKINFSVTVDDSVADSHIGDSVRVRQVIMNLGSNAIRFTDEGSVSITIAALSDDDQSQTLRICVTDTGIGMTQEQQESILDVDTVTVPERGGCGLGLKIVQNIVKMMQGSVRIECDGGTTFCADIVLVKVTDVYDQDELLADVTPEHCVRNVLLVEDNIHIQTLVGITLAATGHTYTVANNGQEAIDRFTADTFDIVLMDIRMPVMGGIEATKAIREIDRHVPIVAMTAHSLRSELEECFEAGCSGYLPKPVDHVMLLSVVESLGASAIQRDSLPI